MNSDTTVMFTHYDATSVEPIIDSTVVPIYVATHTDVVHDPFYGAERFVERLRGYVQAPGFELVIGQTTRDALPVGQAFGYALPQNARWWEALTTSADPAMIAENGSRTFALCDLMVHPDWLRRGIAHALHDELLFGRPEQRATLLVRENNTAARDAYDRWGWYWMGKLQPFPDSPHFDVLILDLK